MFKKFFKKKKGKKISLKKDDHVRHDWVLALFVFFVMILLAIGLSFFIFLQTNTIEEKEADVLENTELIDEELLGETLEYYESQEETYLKYQNTAPVAPEL